MKQTRGWTDLPRGGGGRGAGVGGGGGCGLLEPELVEKIYLSQSSIASRHIYNQNINIQQHTYTHSRLFPTHSLCELHAV